MKPRVLIWSVLITGTCYVRARDLSVIGNVDASSGSSTNDGLAPTTGDGHGPKQNISASLVVAGTGDVVQVAAGFYQETNWQPSGQQVGLPATGKVVVYDSDPFTTDTDADGMTDGWEAKYGLDGLNPADAAQDADDDGFTNLEEFQIGSDPTDSVSHVSAILTIPNAWAIYLSSNTVQVTADIRSTNRFVTVKAAEFFLDSATGVTNGTGTAMSATNSTFNSTNMTAVGTFTPSFAYGERHEIFVHAQGKDKQWCPFKKVIINPNINDILDKVKANYSQIGNITYSMTSKEFVDNQAISTHTVLFRQKGPYKMRWDDQTEGTTMIIDGNQIGVIDESGKLTPMFVVIGDNASAENSKSTHFYWDTDRFQTQHNFGTVSAVTNQPGSYVFVATPQTGVAVPYDSMDAVVDFRYGAVTAVNYAQGGVPVYRMQQPSPMEIAPGVWYQTQQNWIIPADTNWDMQHTEELQTQTIQINSGTVSDSLFDF